MLTSDATDTDAALELAADWLRRRPAARRRLTAMSTDDYWCRINERLGDFGISRVADITGLDVIGFPVVQAVRPLALSNSVNQGKGVSLKSAAVAAVMEAIETFAAETVDRGKLVEGTARAVLGDDAARILQGHLFEDVTDTPWQDEPLTWIHGVDLATGRRRLVPSALVHTDFVPTSPHCHTPFVRSTTGLGAGPDFPHSVRHGLFEVIERLATANAVAMHGFFDRCRIAPEKFAGRETLDLLDRLGTLGILSGHFVCPSPKGVCAIWTRLIDDRSSAAGLPLPADGYACRTHVSEAISASLHEAIQTRCSVIAGGRDDLTRHFYPRYPDEALLEFERARLRSPMTAETDHPPVEQTPTGRDDDWFDILLNAFAQIDLTPVCVPLIVRDDIPLVVTRTVAIGAVEPEALQ